MFRLWLPVPGIRDHLEAGWRYDDATTPPEQVLRACGKLAEARDRQTGSPFQGRGHF